MGTVGIAFGSAHRHNPAERRKRGGKTVGSIFLSHLNNYLSQTEPPITGGDHAIHFLSFVSSEQSLSLSHTTLIPLIPISFFPDPLSTELFSSISPQLLSSQKLFVVLFFLSTAPESTQFSDFIKNI